MRVNFFSQSGNQSNSGPAQGLNATITGPLILAGNPTGPLEATPKQYVDSAINSLNASNIKTGFLLAARLPAFTGDAASATGSGNFILANTGVVAGTYTKVTVDGKGRVLAGSNITNDDIPPFSWSKVTTGKPTTVDGYGITDALKTSGGTVTGSLSLNLDPTDPMHAANKQYVDSLGGNGSNILTGTITRRPVSVTPTGFLRANGGRVSQTTYSALFSAVRVSYITEKNISYTSYLAIGGGQPWRNQHDSNSHNASLGTWSAGTSLPGTRYAGAVAVTKNKVYYIGGYDPNGNAMNTVYMANIGADGVIGTWSLLPGTLPVTLVHGEVVVTKNKVYVLGGIINGGVTANTYYAPINADGTLGAWTAGTALNTTRHANQAVVTKTYAYLFGGTGSDMVLRAPISTDGTIGAWENVGTVGASLWGSTIVVVKNRIYMFGGVTTSATHTNTIRYNDIQPNGSLSGWVLSSATLPNTLAQSQAIVTKDKVFLLGGEINVNSPHSLVWSCPISDKELGNWSVEASLSAVRSYSDCVVTNSKVYLIGGLSSAGAVATTTMASISDGLNDYSAFYNGTINKFDGTNVSGKVVIADTYVETSESHPGNGQPWRQQYQINNTQSGDIASWANLAVHAVQVHLIVTKNYVYTIGGSNTGGGAINQIYRAAINADGTIGSWALLSNTLPISAAWGGSAFVVKNRVYIIGSETNSINAYTTTIDPVTGELGATWSVVPGPTSGMRYCSTAVVSDRVYALSSIGVHYATVNSDGTLGTWVTAASSPSGIYNAAMFVVKNKVYILGHHNGGAVANANMYVATINADGSLGAFSALPVFPIVAGGASFLVTASTVYIFGGTDGTNVHNNVYRAAINADGTLGSWISCQPLSTAMHRAQSFATSSRIYLIGGLTTAQSTGGVSCVAPLNGGLNDYSNYNDGTFTYAPAGTFALPDLSSVESANEYYFIKT